MKKIFKHLIFGCAFLFICLFPSQAMAKDIEIYLNSTKIPTQIAPVHENGRVLVPIRVISESLGATVNYYSETKKIAVIYSGTTINLQLGSTSASVGSTAHILDALPKVTNGTTLVPLRFIGESMGLQVAWNNPNKQVLLTRQSQTAASPKATADSSQLETELFNLINSSRESMGLAKLILVEPLSQMARLHSTDMYTNSFFNHISPTNGNTEKRALALGLIGVGENIGAGYPDASTLFDAWVNSTEHRENIYSEEATFIGIGCAKPNNTYNTDIYATAAFIWGEGFFTMSRNGKIQGNQLTVTGYAKNSTNIVLFHLDPSNSNKYTSRKSIPVTVDSNHAFSVTVDLPEQGLYSLSLGNDLLSLDNR